MMWKETNRAIFSGIHTSTTCFSGCWISFDIRSRNIDTTNTVKSLFIYEWVKIDVSHIKEIIFVDNDLLTMNTAISYAIIQPIICQLDVSNIQICKLQLVKCWHMPSGYL